MTQRSTVRLNSELFFARTGNFTKVRELSLPCYLLIIGARSDGFMPFSRVLAWGKTKAVSPRIWTRGVSFISWEYYCYVLRALHIITIPFTCNITLNKQQPADFLISNWSLKLNFFPKGFPFEIRDWMNKIAGLGLYLLMTRNSYSYWRRGGHAIAWRETLSDIWWHSLPCQDRKWGWWWLSRG